jgi:hypothetical protein
VKFIDKKHTIIYNINLQSFGFSALKNNDNKINKPISNPGPYGIECPLVVG